MRGSFRTRRQSPSKVPIKPSRFHRDDNNHNNDRCVAESLGTSNNTEGEGNGLREWVYTSLRAAYAAFYFDSSRRSTCLYGVISFRLHSVVDGMLSTSSKVEVSFTRLIGLNNLGF